MTLTLGEVNKGIGKLSVDTNQANKELVWAFWDHLDNSPVDTLAASGADYMSPNMTWNGPDPLNTLSGRSTFLEAFWIPFRSAFRELRRKTFVYLGGQSSGRVDGLGDGRNWVGGTGVFDALYAQDWLGIPAHNQRVRVRWGEFCRVEESRVVEIYMLLDLVDLMQQTGVEVLPPSRGRKGVYPPPAADDGVLLDPQDPAQSANSLSHIRRFIFDGLNSYDQDDLSSMGIAGYFSPDVQWYGPGGIGACASLKEFEDLHQRPWLHAYPDRQVQDLDALIAEGAYSGGPGWAGVKATHTGKYLDAEATGKTIAFNGIDFWKREGDRYVENWVFVDMVHLFRQFGIDLFERLTAQVADS